MAAALRRLALILVLFGLVAGAGFLPRRLRRPGGISRFKFGMGLGLGVQTFDGARQLQRNSPDDLPVPQPRAGFFLRQASESGSISR